MTNLLTKLDPVSPVARVILMLLPHLRAPVVLEPAPGSALPQGCVLVPRARLIIAGAIGPLDAALTEAQDIASALQCDLLLVSLRPPGAASPFRFDALIAGESGYELLSDLVFGLGSGDHPVLLPRYAGDAISLGRSGLIGADPFLNHRERATAIARGRARIALSIWGEGADEFLLHPCVAPVSAEELSL